MTCTVEIEQDGSRFSGTIRGASRRGMVLLLEPSDAAELAVGSPAVIHDRPTGGRDRTRFNVRILWKRLREADEPEPGAVMVGAGRLDSDEGIGEAWSVMASRFPARLLVPGSGNENLAALGSLLAESGRIFDYQTGAEALRLLRSDEFAAIIVVEDLPDMPGARLLRQWMDCAAGTERPKVIFLSAEALPDERTLGGEIFYCMRKSTPPDQLLTLVRAAIDAYWAALLPDPDLLNDEGPESARELRLIDTSRRLAMQQDQPSACRLAAASAEDLIGDCRAYCSVYDPERALLCVKENASGEERSWSASLGIAGFVARTGIGIEGRPAAEDPRYVGRVDNPHGSGDEYFWIHPVLDRKGSVSAVLSVFKNPARAGFSQSDRSLLKSLAGDVALCFARVDRKARPTAFSSPRQAAYPKTRHIFRAEALEYQAGGERAEGEPLRISSAWLGWTYYLVISCSLLLLLGYLALTLAGSTDEYSSGPAVVRTETGGETTGCVVTAFLPGNDLALLEPGLPLRFEMKGHLSASTDLKIDWIDANIVGVDAVRRHLGPEIADNLRISVPVVMVHARLPSPTFAAAGRLCRYQNGMLGAASVRLGSGSASSAWPSRLRTIFMGRR